MQCDSNVKGLDTATPLSPGNVTSENMSGDCISPLFFNAQFHSKSMLRQLATGKTQTIQTSFPHPGQVKRDGKNGMGTRLKMLLYKHSHARENALVQVQDF